MPHDPEVPTPDAGDRFAPRAAGAMADMFDQVAGRYGFLNRLMTLGRDTTWRRTLWRCVPEGTRVVLDLCTGDGSSLPGLRRPGRLVVGFDVSLAMLERAQEEGRAGWAPRLVCGDAFHLPFRTGAADCVTVMFGVRNLRPRADALAEVRRVLRPEGRLLVLEATGPGHGPFAPFHRFHLRHVVPLLGRLSPDPSAYAYLARSIEEFGSGPEFERDLEAAGFTLAGHRRFLLGAAALWEARAPGAPGAAAVQPARLGKLARGEMPTADPRDTERRIWQGAQLVVSTAILGTLLYALFRFRDADLGSAIEPWQERGMGLLLIVGAVAFVVRTIVLAARLFGPPPRR